MDIYKLHTITSRYIFFPTIYGKFTKIDFPYSQFSTNFKALESFSVCSLTTVQLNETSSQKGEKSPNAWTHRYWRSLGPFSGLMLCCEDSQGSACGHTQSCDLLRWKDIEQNQQSERNMGQNLGETKCKLPESPPSGVTQHALNFPDNKLWKPVWIAALSGVAESVFICLFLSRMVDINVFVDGAWH